MRNRDVGPPIPGRDANLFRDVIDAVNGSSFVASRNDKRAIHSGERRSDCLNDKRFPLAGDGSHIKFSGIDQSVNDYAPSYVPYNDNTFPETLVPVQDRGGPSRNTSDVSLQA